jgi:hypothetical protein
MTQTTKRRVLVLAGLVAVIAVGASTILGQGLQGGSGDPAKDLGAVRADLQSMESGESRVSSILQAAKRQKDIVKTSCVHEKLTHLKNIIALAREQFSKYLADRTSGTESESVPLRQKISIFKERADEKVAEAERCAGEAIAVTDRAVVEETVDPEIPQWDPTEPSGPIWVMPRPPVASPYF